MVSHGSGLSRRVSLYYYLLFCVVLHQLVYLCLPHTAPLKCSLQVEARAWKILYGKHLNLQYKAKMEVVVEFQEEYLHKLNRPIKDLEDVRQAMAALEAIRQKQIEIDMSLGPIEVTDKGTV